MIQMEDDAYAKLLKDANDNKSLIKIIRLVCITAIFVMIFFAVILPVINVQLNSYRNSIARNDAIEQAHTAVQIREIESVGLSTEEYLKWLEITNN